MDQREIYQTNSKWEPIVGYSRAVRVGNMIEVAGTCAVDEDGNAMFPGDAYGQTKRIFEIISKAIEALGGSRMDIVRTRIFVTRIEDWQEVGRAHGEIFQIIRPVTTMVEVSKLISPSYIVEIEASAIVRN